LIEFVNAASGDRFEPLAFDGRKYFRGRSRLRIDDFGLCGSTWEAGPTGWTFDTWCAW
jgi:hypothetical protein